MILKMREIRELKKRGDTRRGTEKNVEVDKNKNGKNKNKSSHLFPLSYSLLTSYHYSAFFCPDLSIVGFSTTIYILMSYIN